MAVVFLMVVVACGGGEGDSCDTSGSKDECDDGLVCSGESSGNSCRKVCTVQEDCPSGLNCNGVNGSDLKSCQP